MASPAAGSAGRMAMCERIDNSHNKGRGVGTVRCRAKARARFLIRDGCGAMSQDE